jgi:hypothetical protein
MKKDKTFDAVKMMRAIRDRMSEEVKGMTPREQIEYIERIAAPRKREKKFAATLPSEPPRGEPRGIRQRVS